MNQSIIDALLVERDGYVRRGRKDRVAQVDAQLALFGISVGSVKTDDVEVADSAVVTEKAVSKSAPRKRKA
jgi:hypothetical protein